MLGRIWLCDPMDCSLPDSSVHGIFQIIILEWVAIFFLRGYHIFIHLSIDGYLSCFHILAIVNNICCIESGSTYMSLTSCFCFLGYIPRNGIADYMVILFLIFWGTTILFSIMTAPIYIPANSTLGLHFLHSLTTLFFFPVLSRYKLTYSIEV